MFASFPVRSVSSPSSWWCLRWGMTPRILPLPPRWERALPPILVISFILCFLETTQSWQGSFEVRATPYWHRVGTNKIRTYPPIATIYVEFFFCGNVGMVFVRQFVHVANHFFNTIQFQHGFSEPCITIKSIVNVEVSSFPALLLDLICSVVFSTTFFLSVPVTMWSALPDVKVRDREETKNGLDVLLVICRIISYEMPARAVDDASVPIRQACFALCFWLNVEYFA